MYIAARDLPGFAWESSRLQTAVMIFGCGQSPSSTAFNLYGLFAALIHHTSFAVPHYLPTAGGNQKSMLTTKSRLILFRCLAVGAPPAAPKPLLLYYLRFATII